MTMEPAERTPVPEPAIYKLPGKATRLETKI